MNNRSAVVQVIYFILYIALQILVVRNLVLFNMAFCYVYVAFLLLAPFEVNRLLFMFIAFTLGFVTDVFYDTIGIHTAACVLLAYLRPRIVSILTPRGGYDSGMQPTLKEMGLQWFLIYGLVTVLLHHFTLFYLEAGGFDMFFFTFGKVLMSTMFTMLSIILLQYLFYNPRRS